MSVSPSQPILGGHMLLAGQSQPGLHVPLSLITAVSIACWNASSRLSPVKARFLFFVSPDICSGAHWITEATIISSYDVSGPHAASLSLLLGIFPTREPNQDLLHCRWILYQLSYQGSPWYFQPSLKLYIWWIRKWRLTEITSVYPSR